MELQQLLESKIYVRNNTSFMPVKDLVNPFLEKINYSDESLIIKTQNEVVNENIEGTSNIAYPRFLLEVNKGVNLFDTQEDSVVGMLVAMDQQNPMVKAYSGTNVKACMNLSIFNATNLIQQNLLNDLSNLWTNVHRFNEEEEKKKEEHAMFNTKLNQTMLVNKQVNHLLGHLLRVSKTGLGTSPIVNAANLLGDKRSIYYFNPEEQTSLFNIYNAITQGITDSKDLFYKPNKSLIAGQLITAIAN